MLYAGGGAGGEDGNVEGEGRMGEMRSVEREVRRSLDVMVSLAGAGGGVQGPGAAGMEEETKVEVAAVEAAQLVDESVSQMREELLSVYRTLCAASTHDAEALRREHEDEIEMLQRQSMLEIQRREASCAVRAVVVRVGGYLGWARAGSRCACREAGMEGSMFVCTRKGRDV